MHFYQRGKEFNRNIKGIFIEKNAGLFFDKKWENAPNAYFESKILQNSFKLSLNNHL